MQWDDKPIVEDVDDDEDDDEDDEDDGKENGALGGSPLHISFSWSLTKIPSPPLSLFSATSNVFVLNPGFLAVQSFVISFHELAKMEMVFWYFLS